MIIRYITRESLRKLFKDAKSELVLEFLSKHISVKSDNITKINGKKYLINESLVHQILVLERIKILSISSLMLIWLLKWKKNK